MRFGAVTVVLLVSVGGACIPKERDFILIPSVTDASGEVLLADPGTISARLTVTWENGEEAPETQVTVDERVTVEDDETQDVLGRTRLSRTTAFDGSLGSGEIAEVDYEGTESPPIELDPAELCDGRTVHLQVLYSTHGSLLDSPQTALSNAFAFACE